MGTIHVPTLLEGILEATAAEAAAKARIATLRAALEDEARRRYAAEGAAPSWQTRELGKVRLEPETPWTATVADPAAFGSWVAEHHPTEATATIPVAATDLEDVLKALEFIGVQPAGDVRVEVRPAWEEPYVAGLAVDVDEVQGDDGTVDRTITVADPDTGQLIPGMTATRKPARLVVTLDRHRRTAAITEAQGAATALLESASGEEADGPDLDELHTRRQELEGLHGDALAAIAQAHGLGSTGTKAALAERVARAELATGRVLRPAASLDAPARPASDQGRIVDDLRADNIDPLDATPTLVAPQPSPLPDDAEVEEVTTVPTDAPVEEPAETDDELATNAGALLDGLSREVLRGYAKSRGISAAGTKGDLLDRLTTAGVTVADVNDYARAARA